MKSSHVTGVQEILGPARERNVPTVFRAHSPAEVRISALFHSFLTLRVLRLAWVFTRDPLQV